MNENNFDYEFKNNLLTWVEALESGKYQQAQHRLMEVNKKTNETSYCCLGVACKLFGKDFGKFDLTTNTESIPFCLKNSKGTIDQYSGLPPVELIRNAFGDSVVPVGFTGGDVVVKDFNTLKPVTVSKLNDQGKSFKEIAKMVRQTYLPETLNESI